MPAYVDFRIYRPKYMVFSEKENAQKPGRGQGTEGILRLDLKMMKNL